MWALASGAFSGDLVYKGAYAAGSYKDGDIVVLNGITYICVRPTSAAPNPWPAPVYDLSAYQPKITYTTTFPASPVDGQIVVLVDNLTAPTYQWHFRYNASSTLAAKWEYIGGTSVTVRVETQENKIEQLPPGDLATVGPQFIVPRGGAYEVMWGCFYWFSNAPGVAYMDIQAGAANPANNAQNAGGQGPIGMNFCNTEGPRVFLGLNAGETICAKYATGSQGGGGYYTNFYHRWIRVTPVRCS